jgi:hypothetical protein
MELDDLKGVWAQYDKKLSENLKLNDELLKLMNFEKHNHALRKPLNLELLNIFIQIFMIGFLTFFLIRLSNEIQYFFTGLIGALLCGISLVFSVVKATRFNRLLYYHLSIMNFQKDITLLRIFIMRLRRIEYVMAALMGITIFPFIIKATANINIFGDLSLLIPGMCCVLGIGFAIGILLNMNVYDKGLKDAEMFLSLIAKFEKDE